MVPAHVVADHVRSHFSSARERLESFRVEFLIKQTLSVHVVDEGESVVVGVSVRFEHARLLVVEDRRLEVAHHESSLTSQTIKIDDIRLQVDGFCHRHKCVFIQHLIEQLFGAVSTTITKQKQNDF